METRLMDVNEVAKQLGTSKAYAYKIMRKLNAELEEKGCLIVRGKISRSYFEERYFTARNHEASVEGIKYVSQ